MTTNYGHINQYKTYECFITRLYVEENYKLQKIMLALIFYYVSKLIHKIVELWLQYL